MKTFHTISLLAFMLAQGYLHAAATSETAILFLGDSLTAGYGIAPELAYPALIQEKINKSSTAGKVINAGISGNTSAGGLRRLGWYFRQKIDILVIALGANDGLRGIDPASTQKNIISIIAEARARNPDIQIILAGMKVPPNMGPEYSQRFSAIFPAIANSENVRLLPFLLEGVGGIRELNLDDGIHPNPDGHRRIAESIWQVLKPMIQREQPPSEATSTSRPRRESEDKF